MAFIENTGLERLWGHIVHRLSLKADKEDLKALSKAVTEMPQADWEQSDESAKDYIKNRPFYADTEEFVIAEEQTITLDSDGRGNITSIDNVYEYLIPGAKFKVEFDGYSFSGVVYEDGDACYHTDFMTESGINVSVYDCSGIYGSSELAGNHTIKISIIDEVVKTIDSKYLEFPAFSGTGENSIVLNDRYNNASGKHSCAEGYETEASGLYSHAEGYNTTASGLFGSHTEGTNTTASGDSSHAEGNNTTASGLYSHAEGSYTIASGTHSHTEGRYTTAVGDYSHAEGYSDTKTIRLTGYGGSTTYKVSADNHNIKKGRVLKYNNVYAKIFTYDPSTLTIATDKTLSSTDLNNINVTLMMGGMAYGRSSHAEGYNTTASGDYSHAEGNETVAYSKYSHTEGYLSFATAEAAHAEGRGTIAASSNQHVQGECNIEDNTGTYAHIVGNGTSGSARSNAHTLDWEGNAWFQGDVYVGSTSGTNKDEGSKKLATVEDVANALGDVDLSSVYTKTEVDTAITNAKNDLLNGAGAAYDTLKELGDLIDNNTNALEALNTVATNKADKTYVDEAIGNINLDTYEFITVADIDEICGSSIVAASEVTL